MSYEIVYSRNFIKTTRGIIPLLLTGSNNCHEWTGRGWRREREWATFYGNKHIEIKEDDLLNFFKQENSNYDFCDWHGKRLYYNDAYDFYKQGIKGAHSLEDWLTNGRYSLKGHHFKISYLNCYLSDWTGGKKGEHILSKNITTTVDLEGWLDEAKQIINNQNDVYICMRFDIKEPITYEAVKNIKGQCIIAFRGGKRYVSNWRRRFFKR